MAGIVIIAIGHHNYYQMSATLAASIKANGSKAPICLLHDGNISMLSQDKQGMFDTNKVIPNKYYEKCPVKAKTFIYNLSPFDKTLYLDADMVILPGKNIDELMTSLEGVDFTIMNEISDYCVWADVSKLREYTGNISDAIRIYYSELIYFEKGEKTKKYFKEVQKCYSEIDFSNKVFAGGMADELAFIAASMKLRIYPHLDNWLPVFWHFRDKKHRHLQMHQLGQHYIGLSAGGNVTNGVTKSSYNNLSIHYSSVMGIQQPYKLNDKRNYLQERITI